ncbi:Hypothetical protein PBC10988_29220 [Planctomycetales bacterium 10988]|nr:Hypothetical protein PBC10988_29220 [Planctomycetales bacterium 10988]
MQAKPSVLIVNSDDEMAHWMSTILGSRGYAVRVAGDGQQAWQQIEWLPPDLLLIDMILPIFGGFHILQRLQARKMRNISTVLFCGMGQARHAHYARLLGAHACLQDPISKDELLELAQKFAPLDNLTDSWAFAS